MSRGSASAKALLMLCFLDRTFSVNSLYSSGDTFSSSDAATSFESCDGNLASIQARSSSGKVVVLDKSYYT
ncbi:hypothetical protein CYMTET_44758 [Cymbomonas tetramitiformis]|uniref:Uncharacterized protein n=1 Tax=Cymbomonas tetramitiformis TaxID=36881 RepID=A0AAE0C1A3_9CHLO|nr:hypothetical protein CYMTET_44758 [Cymbomonas tetramitiformis]